MAQTQSQQVSGDKAGQIHQPQHCLVSIATFGRLYPDFTAAAIRAYRFEAEHGDKSWLRPAFLKLGGRVFIDPVRFFDLIRAHNDKARSEPRRRTRRAK